LAFKDAAQKANPVLLEPVMNLVVVIPDEYLGEITGDINAKRGKIVHMDMSGGSRIVKIMVPLAEMFGYASTLRTITQGRGIFSMEFFQFQPTSLPIMEGIIARVEGRIPAH
jgi:elongation factor G